MEKNRNRELFIGSIIFIICLLVYLVNGRTIGSGDTVPNSILAFNLLENHTFSFDNLRGTYLETYAGGYFFIDSIQGKLTSIYPIGAAIITFPFYLIFYLCLKISSIPVDLTSNDFESYRLLFEKLAATLTTSIAVVFFYLTSRLKFERKISLISTIIYALATSTWSINSQAMWQHTALNLALIITIYCFLKANREGTKNPILLLVLAGCFAGLLPGIRPTAALFTMAAIVYSFLNFRSKSIWFVLGLTSVLPSIAWNWYYFGNLTGGYSKVFQELGVSPYIINLEHFISTGLALLISPSRGLLFFSPILIFSIFGAYRLFKSRLDRDKKLIGLMTIGSMFIFINYSFYFQWSGGHCYGPRFLTDILPITCYLINYSIVNIVSRKNSIAKEIVLGFFIILSIYPQVVGVFAYMGSSWTFYPVMINHGAYEQRFWHFRDNQIQRHANGFYYQIFPPQIRNEDYIQGFSGSIEEVRVIDNLNDKKGRSLNDFDLFKPGDRLLVKANLKNKGQSTWFGYTEALEKGETRIAVIFYDENDVKYQESHLFVYGKIKPNKETTALADFKVPDRPGNYKLVFSFVLEKIADISERGENSIYESKIKVSSPS